MTFEHRPGGSPASPDIDMGMPEICEKCDRDCPEPCEALKRIIAITTHLQKYPDKRDPKYSRRAPNPSTGHTVWNIPYFFTNLETWITTLRKILGVEK